MDLDPESAEFYDYTTMEWYREPERTGEHSVAGPYVDFICTQRVHVHAGGAGRCAGRFTGVAAADILAAQVERLVLPGLSGLGRTAVLASGARPGHRLDQREPAARRGAAPPPRAAGFVPRPGPARGRRRAGGRRQTCCRGRCSPFPLDDHGPAA